ncbi:MAG: PspC domain-containing protein [Microlunatus sp.]|nr:PspC domain-containing protein [Microlunatus sp.]MDN5769347.1 PspC domain-containing protein [Microlunatus sp.]MDN5804563.1 PspC domain-containing protein [Microlunatus sp.]
MSSTGYGSQQRPDASAPVLGARLDPGGPGPGVPGTAEGPELTENSERADRPRATRVAEGAVLGGVCTGLARHLGWPVLVIRIGFVGLLLVQFLGAIAYGALWLLLPPEQEETAPGLEAASRSGLRTANKPPRRIDWGSLLALAALATGLLWLVQTSGWGISQHLFWPVAFACAGAALVWRQADSSQQRRWTAEGGGQAWLAPFVARGGWPAVLRVIVGLALVGASFGMVVAQQNLIQELPEVMAMTMLALAGLAVVLAPWLYRSRTALSEARAEKVRADARADMAAHLHDSVLQTLALIQRQAEDPKAVQQLARRQERELRSWLYGEHDADTTLKAALATAAAEVEDERGVPVEVVAVGDCDLTESLIALVRAAREALVNAAKHSGAAKIDLFAEVDDERVEVFVRDRGAGFDLEAVDDDRLGVKHSIMDRMDRHNGSATIRTAPGQGTEVRLEIRR